jgi:hypothetical protein
MFLIFTQYSPQQEVCLKLFGFRSRRPVPFKHQLHPSTHPPLLVTVSRLFECLLDIGGAGGSDCRKLSRLVSGEHAEHNICLQTCEFSKLYFSPTCSQSISDQKKVTNFAKKISKIFFHIYKSKKLFQY